MYLKQLALVALAGAIGTLSRFAIAEWVQTRVGVTFPWGTLAVNCLGCFLFGIVWILASDLRIVISPHARFIVSVGFLGAFTTFSTFAFETAAMLSDGRWLLALTNMTAHNLLGVAAVLIGIASGRWYETTL